MITLDLRVQKAKTDSNELNQLLHDYLPFIKKQLTTLHGYSLEYDDMFSLAMLAFINSVMQYHPSKGNFISFSQVCIRHRILDEIRKQKRYEAHILPLESEDIHSHSELSIVSTAYYDRLLEQQSLSMELELLNTELARFNISFDDLAKLCPKQIRSRKLCLSIAKKIQNTTEYLNVLYQQHKLMQQNLSQDLNISSKTIEKYRKYIIALVVISNGDYPYVKSYLPYRLEVS